ncbi:hypothetical protein HBI56_184040 [Parastagonospora nodorum]|uniref:Mid2 domain-containing protein n=2 Tax=Phaeosphaeria nodorum (strain SN15 / ATCC MYA-4574 / FGSC 10173) TaxID=321614 RepID=A0A7U2FD24_PHANO|nr:hypothetical protein SNOG_14199 [Parastagonospora nodorum SN15]KAH3907266.1 hypothetical protein HBH56_192510 [Parastagonospora nodorum]EAT78436.1 hypothetical protein SNOG_14199 [Parastagonospora nodorum SN15]KAH3938291.1 hypothetical protein HBH54_009450 [Parastagonospora nodorum]KAH3940777.1 hypothetical protein HBH53_212850 [Parastagonospora nodorum]KAH3966458.1 hypothetical protein HBH52_198410 [Parastagonospora nodorum]
MKIHFALILYLIYLPLQACCQTVQDDWTAPAAPEGSTPLQSGSKFTLIWKIGLQDNCATYCPLCDTKKLDLWITNFNGTKYTSKIGRGIDIATTASYDWNVNIAFDAFPSNDFWVFRFTFFDSDDSFAQQISSPGFKISGLIKASSTVVIPSSSATSSRSTSSNLATTSSTPQPTAQPITSISSSKSKTWISGVVVGPVVRLLLGAVLMWFCLRRRKSNRVEQNQANRGHGRDEQGEQDAFGQVPKEGYFQTRNQDQQIAEVSGHTTPKPPAELWEGNYRSKP